jgi:hypothetical protein
MPSHAAHPADVDEWYEAVAREIVRTLGEAETRDRIAADDTLWAGPVPERMSERRSQGDRRQ